jgi:hypothetical protein
MGSGLMRLLAHLIGQDDRPAAIVGSLKFRGRTRRVEERKPDIHEFPKKWLRIFNDLGVYVTNLAIFLDSTYLP